MTTPNRPSFAAAWAASQRIYDPLDSARKVAQLVGGRVADHIHDKKSPWNNTCAVRLSYILNQSGQRIPLTPGKTKTDKHFHNYFYRVDDLIDFLSRHWGPPKIVSYPPSNGGALAGKKGIILFEVTGWADARGHATLFNGTSCYDHCYFNEPGARYTTTKANFWELS